MAELGFRQTGFLAPPVSDAAEAAFLPTLPGADVDLSALVDTNASIRIESGDLILAPAFGPVVVLENFVAATADRTIAVLLPGGTVIPSDQLIDLLAAPVDFSVADIIARRLAATAPPDDPTSETTGSPPEPDPAPVRLIRDEESQLRIADTAPPETVRGRSVELIDQEAVAGPRPEIALAPPAPDDSSARTPAPPPVDERAATAPPPLAGSTPAPGTVSGSSGDDALTLSAPAVGVTVDLGNGSDTLTLADGVNDVTVAHTETIRGGDGDDTVRLADVPSLIDLSDGVDTLDFSALAAADLSAAGAQYQNVEAVDLRGGAGTTLTLNAQDVLDLSPDTDTLLVNGDSDVVAMGSGWTVTPGTTPSGEAANVYTQALGGRTATIIVDGDVSVA